MKKLILIFFIGFLFVGCASKHTISLIDFNSSDILEGVYDESDNSVIVVMPNKEVLTGKYSNLEDNQPVYLSNTIGYSSGRHGGFGGVGFGVDFNSQSTNYALLTSATSELKMEILITKKSWTKNGFGEAKTNDGRVYKIQF